jgi:flagellin
MSVVINTNPAATSAAFALGQTNGLLQKSLARLSSGSRLVTAQDDAAGLGVSMKLSSAIRRTDATNNNVGNAISFLQVQDGALKIAGNILDRISELVALYDDVTKSSTDKSNYDLEFTTLKAELNSLDDEAFNEVSLFGGTTLSVVTTEQGGTTDITQSGLADSVADITAATTLDDLATDDVTGAIQNVANDRAQNGADSSVLGFISELLAVNKANLEAANSRISDVDVARESSQLARYNILQQAGTAMLAQANQSSQSVLRLLQ